MQSARQKETPDRLARCSMSAARSNRTSNSGSMALQVFKLPRRPRCKVNQALPHTRRRRPFCKQNERKSNFKTSRANSKAVKQSKTKEPAMHSTRKEKVCAQKFFFTSMPTVATAAHAQDAKRKPRNRNLPPKPQHETISYINSQEARYVQTLFTRNISF